MTSHKRGAFIVIEGLDRAGKSTQVEVLKARIERHGLPVQAIKFPDRTTLIGKMIDEYLRSGANLDDHVVHLLFSANRWEQVDSLRNLLASGKSIICDRYAFSGVAFSAAKGLPLEWCRAPDVSLPAPDLTVFLDVSPEKARERGGYGEERYENQDMQERVRSIFNVIGEEMSATSPSRWVTLSADDNLDIVSDKIWDVVLPTLEHVEENVGVLWSQSKGL